MRSPRPTGSFSLAVLLSACAAAGPAPIEGLAGRTTAGPRPERAETRAPRPHPEAPAPAWAEGPGVPLSAWALQPAEAQPFDPAALPKAHAVAPGETLFAISTRYQVPLRALIDLNRLSPPYQLGEGQVLALPKPRFHRVAAGESLLRIADRYAVDPRSLALLNRLPQPYTLRPGDELVLPVLARDAAPARAAAATPAPSIKIAKAAGSKPAPPPAPAPTAKPAFALGWPASGKILVAFGPQPGGRRSDGVDLAVTPGPIKAAADGEVVYAGADLPAYGNLMLIQHAGGWVTAYAHAERLTRKAGEKVRKGDEIAIAGPAKGGAARLHFQIRRGAAPADPVATLGPPA